MLHARGATGIEQRNERLPHPEFAQVVRGFRFAQVHQFAFDLGADHDRFGREMVEGVFLHCAHVLHHRLKLEGTLRASAHIFNDEEDIERLIAALHDLV